MPQPFTLSFAGCAWCVPYHFGVAHTLQQRGLPAQTVYVGASSGALAAAALAAGLDPKDCFQGTLRSAARVARRWRGPAGRMSELVRDALEELLPKDAHERAHGRFRASVTKLPLLQTRLLPLGRLRSRRELIELVLASCYIPLYYERPARWRRGLYLDGGLRNNQPRLGPHTLTVSPFRDPRAPAQIRPAQPPPRRWALFPTEQSLRHLFDEGRRDAERFEGLPVAG